MKPRPVIFLIIAALLASCSTPPLWGTYSTPTPDAPAPLTTPTQPSPPTPTVRIQPSPAAAPTVTPKRPTPTAVTSTPFSGTPKPPRLYYSQSGDTLPVVAAHFGVDVSEINAAVPLPESGLLNPGTLLVIPDRLPETTSGEQILPDSELVFSATAIDFDTQAYVKEAGGYLSTYREYLGSTGWTTGAQGIARLALENSINPRLLIALIEHESGWVTGQPANLSQTDFPLGYTNPRNHGLFRQMMLAVQDISVGYYGWRDGTLTELTFPDGTTKRIAPDLNAGSVAIQYFFSLRLDPERWAQTIDPRAGFPALYLEMFGDPWARAQ
ncbi:MAG: LysM peptidoglycan-binding domain-containing protein, partial [Chloroflexi bacterium]|nr:LysM peptidoglycan-binding domain-containing protein [Chloroflexota bacterium]